MTLIGYFALLFAVNKTANSALGLVSVFALTGFMGYTLGPIIGFYLQAIPNGHVVVLTALGMTAVAFVAFVSLCDPQRRALLVHGRLPHGRHPDRIPARPGRDLLRDAVPVARGVRHASCC